MFDVHPRVDLPQPWGAAGDSVPLSCVTAAQNVGNASRASLGCCSTNCSSNALSPNRHQVLAGSRCLPATVLDIPSISVLLYQDSFSWEVGTGATKTIIPPEVSCSLPKGHVAARVTHTMTGVFNLWST